MEYKLFGAENCFVQSNGRLANHYSQPLSQRQLLRCPLPIKTAQLSSQLRVRLYTLPEQTAHDCYVAGSTSTLATYYRFARFTQFDGITKENGGLIYEAKLGGGDNFISPSEGETWHLKYEIQCTTKDQPLLHAYSVIRTASMGGWVTY